MKQLLVSQLSILPIQNKRVLLRADLNVSIINNTIINDFRLKAILPTINLIQKNGGKIILITHMGRPKNKESELSTKQLIPWFENHEYIIDFAQNLNQAKIKSTQNSGTILLLENIRFFPGEKKQDESFAKQLASLGDFYVNDAFGVMHRKDASVTLVPQLFDPNKRTIGLLVEKEISMLNSLFKEPQHPYILILGGKKIDDKIPLLQHMLEFVDMILLCPAIVFTFLKARGIAVGQSLVDDSMLDTCRTILYDARKKKVEIVYPVDYQITQRKKRIGPLAIVDADSIPYDGFGISIGPQTQILFAQKITHAKTMFFNGMIGFLERPETLEGTEAIFKAIARSDGLSIISGGDSVSAAHLMGIAKNIDYISTGGGATLTYLSGKKLPGLDSFA